MSKRDILNKYGKDISKSDIEDIKKTWEYGSDYSATYVRTYQHSNGMPATEGIRAGEEVSPGFPYQDNIYNHHLLPVFEVEWIDVDDKFVM
jgi:hypothetical protein